jgi:hypothetical protein
MSTTMPIHLLGKDGHVYVRVSIFSVLEDAVAFYNALQNVTYVEGDGGRIFMCPGPRAPDPSDPWVPCPADTPGSAEFWLLRITGQRPARRENAARGTQRL